MELTNRDLDTINRELRGESRRPWPAILSIAVLSILISYAGVTTWVAWYQSDQIEVQQTQLTESHEHNANLREDIAILRVGLRTAESAARTATVSANHATAAVYRAGGISGIENMREVLSRTLLAGAWGKRGELLEVGHRGVCE